jgi:hypothetical protein
MGELIEFKKSQGNVWDDAGEAFPEEEAPESPRPGVMILPILLFLDAFSLALALVCRPIAATVLVIAGAVIWAFLRDFVGFGVAVSLGFCLIAWLVAHFLERNIDQLIKAIESVEAGAMRATTQRGAGFGRALHLALYLYVASVPFAVAAFATGLIAEPHWLPRSLAWKPLLGVPTLLALGLAVLPAAVAVTTRYYWHPVARHATLLGNRRKFTIAGKRAEAA